MRLGSHTFSWEPDTITSIDRRKSVSVVPTYSGAAHFQWAAIFAGVPITLTWKLMQEAEYQALRSIYASTDQVEFNPDQRGVSFNVVVTDFTGRYIETVNAQQPYRTNVQLTLSIVSQASTTTTTTTTTSTTTTTTA